MALAYDASSQASTAGATSLTWSHTCTGTDRAIEVDLSYYAPGGQTVTGVTYAGVALTQIDRQDDGATDWAEIWVLSNPASGANNIVASFSGSIAAVGGGKSYTGAHQTTASLTGTPAKASGSSTTPTVTVTSAVGEIASDCVANFLANESPDTGTERWDQSNADIGGAGSTRTGAATVAMDWTLDASASWAIVAVSIKPSAAAGDPEGGLIGGKLLNGGLLIGGVLVR